MIRGIRHNSNNESNQRNRLIMMDMDAFLEDPNRGSRRSNNYVADDPSVAETFFSRSIGSVMNPHKTAFLRSLTMSVSDTVNGVGNVTFSDPVTVRKLATAPPSSSSSSSTLSSSWSSLKKGVNKVKHRNRKSVTIGSLEGDASLSQIAVGDVVTRINGKKIGPSYNAQRCTDFVEKICEQSSDGNDFVTIQTGNEQGLTTILEATVLKPYPEATALELGLEVWWWKGLLVRDVLKNSMFFHSGIETDDAIESINGVNMVFLDESKVEEFERIFRESPLEVTIVVKRKPY